METCELTRTALFRGLTDEEAHRALDALDAGYPHGAGTGRPGAY